MQESACVVSGREEEALMGQVAEDRFSAERVRFGFGIAEMNHSRTVENGAMINEKLQPSGVHSVSTGE